MASQASTDSTRSAPLLRRLAASAYDALLLLAIEMVAAALWLPVFKDQAPAEHPLYQLYRLTLLLIAFAFFMGFWLRGGQTLGMRSWRLRLLAADGSAPSFRQAALRFAVAILSWLPAGLGFWWALLDSERRTWHDLASGTRLILEPKQL